MPIASITTDYTGRAKDINVMPGVNPRTGAAQPVATGFGAVSSYCAGIQKLIQRFMVALLTVQGSQPGYPAFGTTLLKKLASSNLVTLADLRHAFNFASAKVVADFRRAQASSDNSFKDEQLDTALLLDVQVTPTRHVVYRVALYTTAGGTYDFLLPIPISK